MRCEVQGGGRVARCGYEAGARRHGSQGAAQAATRGRDRHPLTFNHHAIHCHAFARPFCVRNSNARGPCTQMSIQARCSKSPHCTVSFTANPALVTSSLHLHTYTYINYPNVWLNVDKCKRMPQVLTGTEQLMQTLFLRCTYETVSEYFSIIMIEIV